MAVEGTFSSIVVLDRVLFIYLFFFSKIRLNELSLIILIYKNVIYLFACKNYMCFFNCNDEDGRSNAF
jgi:hypothetical protein